MFGRMTGEKEASNLPIIHPSSQWRQQPDDICGNVKR
jgi:hypothetical protein